MANANKHFIYHMLFSYGFVNFTDNLSHLLFLALIGLYIYKSLAALPDLFVWHLILNKHYMFYGVYILVGEAGWLNGKRSGWETRQSWASDLVSTMKFLASYLTSQHFCFLSKMESLTLIFIHL